MTPHLANQICLWAAVALPIALIIAFRWVGVVLGALAVWFLLWLAGVWMSALDPKRDAAILDSIWVLFGWVGGLIYCLSLMGLREAVEFFIRRSRSRET